MLLRARQPDPVYCCPTRTGVLLATDRRVDLARGMGAAGKHKECPPPIAFCPSSSRPVQGWQTYCFVGLGETDWGKEFSPCFLLPFSLTGWDESDRLVFDFFLLPERLLKLSSAMCSIIVLFDFPARTQVFTFHAGAKAFQCCCSNRLQNRGPF